MLIKRRHYLLFGFCLLLLVQNSELLGQKIGFSEKRGYYDAPISLTLSTDIPGATIKYTLNNTKPSASNGTTYNGTPINIASTETVRAFAYSPGVDTSKVKSNTYIFLDQIISAGYMSNNITNSGVYGPQMENSLKAIPAISIVSNQINGTNHISTEIETSVEMIFPNGKEGFMRHCGIQTWGGSPTNPKKHYRLEFKEIYGASKLEYELFEPDAYDNHDYKITPAREFDRLLLRAGSQDGLNGEFGNENRAQFLRNRFFFDTQIETGYPAPHGRYVHVFVNQEYVGHYHLLERPDAGFFSSYYGGSKSDYEVRKSGEYWEGNGSVYNSLGYNIDLSSSAGIANTNNYLDLKSAANYLNLMAYASGFDWSQDHNSLAGGNVTPGNGGYQFLMWDVDLSFGNGGQWHPSYSGDPNYFSAPLATGPVPNLVGNTEFNMMMADNMQCHCFDGGLLTPESVESRYEDRANQIKTSLIAESARWGNVTFNGNGNVNVNNWDVNGTWTSELNRLKSSYIPQRTNNLINHYKNNGIYPNIGHVSFNNNGGIVNAGYNLTLNNTNGNGTIYYTTNGQDPRNIGGSINNSASSINGNGSITLSPGVVEVKARVYQNGQWSAMCPKKYYVGQQYTNLQINEIHYNPIDSIGANGEIIDSDNFEFLEIKNTGNTTIFLEDVSFVDGIYYTFPAGSSIPPGGFYVLAEGSVQFQSLYGVPPSGVYEGKLKNSGEQLLLADPVRNIIDQVDYKDDEPWDSGADNLGPSLALKLTANIDNALASNWSIQQVNYTPFADNYFCLPYSLNGFTYDVSCHEGNDGFLQVSQSGGDGPFTYLWSNGETTSSIANLPKGTYEVTVTDANGCEEIASWEIIEPDAAVSITTNQQDQIQFNVNDGSATATVTGGTQGYTYSWSNGENTETINNLAPGDYSLTVTDANDCTEISTITISPVDCVINASSTGTDVSYFETNNGSATASASGGPEPYSYVWSNGVTTPYNNSLAPGSYTVTVTADNLCFDVSTVIIEEVDCSNFTLDISKTDETYLNIDDGSATATASGTAPYSYLWSNGAGTESIENLSPGTYTVTTVDAVGCSDIQSITIDAIVCNNFNLTISGTDVTYVNANDGTASANPSGMAPYTYSWSNGADTKDVSGLEPGTYSLTVVDAVGCSGTAAVNIEDVNCASLTLNVIVTDESEFDANDGTATASASGANPDYTYEWSTGEISNNISDLGAGDYSVTVTDNLGCTKEKLFSVSPGNTGIVYGKIYLDGNNNGTLDANESGIADVEVLVSQSDGVILTLNTNSDGDWSAVVSTGLTLIDIIDGDPELNGFLKTEGTDQELITVGLGSETDAGLDGYFIISKVCGHLYMDVNDNGTQNAGEIDLANVDVIITDALGNVQTIATDANGDYCANVYEGTITLNINNTDPEYPTGFNISEGVDPSTINAEPGITKDATPVGFSLCPVLDAGDNKTICITEEINLGTANTIANGSGNYAISWSPAASLDDPTSANPIASPSVTTTYTLSVVDQASGCTLTDQITVNVTQAQIPEAGDQKVIECGDAIVIGANPIANNGTPFTWSNGVSGTVSNGDPGQITVSPDQTSMYYLSITDNGCTTVDSVLVVVECEGILCGDLFMDTNGNGVQDVNENDLANVDIVITDELGNLYNVTTDNNGEYCETILNGTTTIAIDRNDSDFPFGGIVSAGSDPNTVTVITSQTINAATVGIFIPADLYGSVYEDANGNGQRDAGEDGFNNIDIIITDVQSNSRTVSTNNNGDWTAQVMPGSATIDIKDSDLAYDASRTEGDDPTTINAIANNNNHAGDDGFILLCSNISMSTTLNNHVSCKDGDDGSAVATATGGKSPYSYQWSDGGTGATRNNLIADNYTVTVTDDNQCTAITTISITEPSILTASASKTDETYNNADDGTASVMANGGTPVYTYLWSNGATTSSVSNLAPGNYIVTITDDNGCMVSESVNISPIDCANFSLTSSHSDVSYNGISDGSASISAVGGASPYTYLWSNGATTASINNLAEGNYTITITDNLGCEAIETITIDPIDCSTLNLNITSTDLSFVGANDGTAEAIVSGGFPPYSYLWNTGQITTSITDLGPGTYTVTITDNLGCETVGAAIINNIDCSSLILTVNTLDETQYQSNDGSATAVAVGGQAPYSYNWSTGGNTQSISNLAPGNYAVTLTDDNGCSTIKNFNILQASTGYLTGKVYEDKNGSGSFDGNDSGIANVDVQITESDGNTLTVTTDASGDWITIVRPGLSLVEILDSNGLLNNGTQSEGNNPTLITAILGQTTHAGDDGFNFFTQICGLLYFDTNNNGINDGDDFPLANISINIMDADGIDHALVTDLDGSYCTELAPGLAIVEVDDSNANFPNGAFFTEGALSNSLNITVGPNVNSDLGIYREITIDVKAYMEGPLSLGDGQLAFLDEMRTSLNDLQLLPGQTHIGGLFGNVYIPPGQPYQGTPWFYNGTEGDQFDSGGDAAQGDAGYPPNAVDWVLISLREGINYNTEVCRAAALLMKDGSIHFVEDFTCNNTQLNEFYIAIEHRNHLIIMSQNSVSLQGGILNFDFRSTQSYVDFFGIGIGQKSITTISGQSFYIMNGGNGEQISSLAAVTDINVNDKLIWENSNNAFSVYALGDFDLTGDTNVNDKILWENNNNNFSSVPR